MSQTTSTSEKTARQNQGVVPRFLTVCDVPYSVERRFYYGAHTRQANACLAANEEDNAASWMWRDWSELDEGFSPVAGTLRAAKRHEMDGIWYVDARDVAEALKNMHGDGI